MCGCLGVLLRHATNRRTMLAATAVGIAGMSLTAESAQAAEDEAERRATETRRLVAESAKGARSRVILLGTAGGPTFWPGSTRVGISSAVVVGDAAYLVDCGSGAARRLQQGLEPMITGPKPGNTRAYSLLRAAFLTHMHSDHTADLPALLLYGYYAGLDLPGHAPLQLFGPGPRGEMMPVFTPPGRPAREVPAFNPANPTPGTKQMIDLLLQAYATDINDRMRDQGRRDPAQLVQAHDIALPKLESFRSPNETPTPSMAPFKVFEDDRVRVSATLVAHAPIFPAFAYRFDTDDGSVVFSGDTGPCDNLITLAKGADVLVHEVIVQAFVDRAYPAPRSPAEEGLHAHLLSAHTTAEQVGKIAEAAGVKTLVLNHMVPGNATAADLMPAQLGFSGRMVIGDDLLEVAIRKT